MPPKPPRRLQRATGRCPACRDFGAKRETTVKGQAVIVSWQCGSCKKEWRERRAKP